MAEQMFSTPFSELPEVYRPQHQYEWSVWEEREELKFPHRPGFEKNNVLQQQFVVCKNGGTKLERALYAAPAIEQLTDTNIPQASDLLSSKVTINVSNTPALAENYFENGMLMIKDGASKGLAYPISNSGAIGTTSSDVVITIDGELIEALDTTSDVSIISSPFRNIRRGGGVDGFGGIPPDEVNPNMYFWLQKKGPAIGTAAAAGIASGEALTPAASGTLAKATAGEPIVAYALETTVAVNEIFAIYLV